MQTRSRLYPIAAAFALAFLAFGCASKPKVAQQKAAFWPAYPDEPRIQFLTSFEKNTDVEAAHSKLDELVMGKEPKQELPIKKPYGVEMWNGRIYVADIRGMCVDIMDVRTKQMLIMGRSGTDPLERPTDIAIAPDGMKYVTDMGKGKVYVFDAQDRQITSFRPSETWKPVSVAVFGNEIFVCDFASQTVGVLDRLRGTYLATIGSAGAGDGQFIRPLSVDVDAQGNIYVLDVLKCQLQKFDRSGKLLSKFGTMSPSAGGFVRPKQIALDKDGEIFVVDAAFQNVQIFDQVGRPLTFFGAAGDHPGGMYLPAGITVHDGDVDLFKQYIHPAFEAQRLIVVTNQFGPNKLAVYAFGHLKQGKTVADISESKTMAPLPTGRSGVAAATQPVNPEEPGFGLTPAAPSAAQPQQPGVAPVAPLGPAQPQQQPQQAQQAQPPVQATPWRSR